MSNFLKIITQNIKYTDEFGVTEYTATFKIVIAFVVLYSYIAIISYFLFLAEKDIGNIKTYADAFWVIQMSASTIGFGDFYPVTTIGRILTAMSFYIGVGLAGYIGGTIAEKVTSFSNTAIKNRELRKQNAEILELLKEIKSQGVNNV